jgi:hypothetical protein
MQAMRITLIPALWLAIAGCPAHKPPPRPVQPQVSHEKKPVEKALTAEQMEEVESTVSVGLTGLKRCYADELERRGDKRLKGKVVFEIVIGRTGAAREVLVKHSELKADEVHECMRAAIRKWEFPKFQADVVYSRSILFEPEY